MSMDRYEKRSQQELRSPSFSSTLLDTIYRSIDEGEVEEEAAEPVFYRDNMRKKQSISGSMRAEKWVEKKTSEKPVLRRKEATDFEDTIQKLQRNQGATLWNSSSSSSESSETEVAFMRPKSVRTGSVDSARAERSLLPSLQRKTQLPEIHIPKDRYVLSQQKPKQESFNKSKSTSSSKFYGGCDLKKPKQPISPGGRLASFLNSLFMAAGNVKKAKFSALDRKSKSDRSSSSTCSSASSYSRSCLSKTPSSRGNSLKSVRFYPVSVIVDEDCRPCGQKRLYEREQDLNHLTVGKKIGESPPLIFGEELKLHLMEKNRQVEEAAKDLLKGYQKKTQLLGEVMRDIHENGLDDDDDYDDDAMSCSSSDLFELDNLASIGIDRYRQELPVYETTHLGTNRAIANGLIR